MWAEDGTTLVHNPLGEQVNNLRSGSVILDRVKLQHRHTHLDYIWNHFQLLLSEICWEDNFSEMIGDKYIWSSGAVTVIFLYQLSVAMDSGQGPSAFICIVDRKFLVEMYNRQHYLLFRQCFVQQPQYITFPSTSWPQSTIFDVKFSYGWFFDGSSWHGPHRAPAVEASSEPFRLLAHNCHKQASRLFGLFGPQVLNVNLKWKIYQGSEEHPSRTWADLYASFISTSEHLGPIQRKTWV